MTIHALSTNTHRLLFFLMLVFMLTALINIQMWHGERLLYFQVGRGGGSSRGRGGWVGKGGSLPT